MSKPTLNSQVSTEAFVPDWLDQKYLTKLLSEEIPEFQNIISISTKQECFVYAVLRVLVQIQLRGGKTRAVNYLIKSGELTKSTEQKFPLPTDFEREYFVYNELLPALEKLYKDQNQEIQFSPRTIKSKNAKTNDLYLEYLQPKGYRLLNNENGLVKLQVEAAIAKLAAYHAASACYLEQITPGKLSGLKKYNKPPKSSTKVENYNALIERKLHERLYSYMLRFFEDDLKAFQKYITALNSSELSVDPKVFNVILLGACWPTNLLANVDAFGHVKDLLFVDFQLTRHGPAVYDLFHLLMTIPILADKIHNFDAFVRFYYDKLIENLKLLKYQKPLPKLTDFHLALLKYSHYGYEAVSKILPIVLSNGNANDLDDVFDNEIYPQQLRQLLMWMDTRAFLEVP